MAQTPQHVQTPQMAQPQGLGAPTAPASGSEFYKPSESLGSYVANQNGAQQQALAQAAQVGAQAGKTQAEAEMLQYVAQQQQGLGPSVGPDVLPQEVQAGQLMEGIVRGEVGQDQLSQMVQAGEISPEVADSAVMQAQQFMVEDAARNEQAMGLGAVPSQGLI